MFTVLTVIHSMATVHVSPDNGYVCEVSETTSLIVNEAGDAKSEGKIGLFSRYVLVKIQVLYVSRVFRKYITSELQGPT